MATTPAAFSASNKYPDKIIILKRMTAQREVLFPLFMDVMIDVAKQLRITSRNPLAFASAFSGSAPSAEQVKMSNHTTTVAEALYAKDNLVPWRDSKLGPDEVAQTMEDTVDGAFRHLESLAAAGLEGALAGTLTVPDGNGSTVGFFAASSGHTLQGGGGQTNKGSVALSAAALTAAKTVIWGWKDNIGNALGLTNIPLVLVVPPALGDLAVALTGVGAIDISTKQVGVDATSGTAAATRSAVNPHAGVQPVINPYLTSDVDWYLLPRGGFGRSPFKAWFEIPEYQMFDQERDRGTYIGVTYNAKVFAQAPTYTTGFGADV